MRCDNVLLTEYMSIRPLANSGFGGFQVILRVSGVSTVTVTLIGASNGTSSVVNRVIFASSPKKTASAAETRNSYNMSFSAQIRVGKNKAGYLSRVRVGRGHN